MIGALFLCGALFISTLLNSHSINYIVASFFYALGVLDTFWVVYRVGTKIGIHPLIKYAVTFHLVIIALNDALFLIVNYGFSNPAEIYLIGSKFKVSYTHCFISAALFYLFGRERKNLDKSISYLSIIPLLFSLFTVGICAKVTCTTGILIELLLIFFMCLPEFAKKLLEDRKTLIIGIIVINVLILGTYDLFSNQYVYDFIYGTLGKRESFIGRLKIYSILVDIVKDKPWLGYGYSSSDVREILGFGNAQNGVFKIIVDCGIIGLLGYVLMMFRSLGRGEKSPHKLWPLWGFIYAMFAASVVEISLTHFILFFAFAILCTTNELERNMKPEPLSINYNNKD